MYLPNLSDDELLRHAQAQHDALTATAVETELLARFERLVDAQPRLSLLKEYDLEDADQLRQVLDRHKELGDAAEDLQQLLARISELTELTPA